MTFSVRGEVFQFETSIVKQPSEKEVIPESPSGPIPQEDASSRFFENNHAVMFLLDPEVGRLVDVNPAAVKYYGWPREEMRGKSIFEINTLSPHEVRLAMREASIGARSLFHFSHRRADGSVCDVDILSGKIRYQGRDLLYSIVHDAGERRAIEEKLAEERQRLQFILEAAEYGTWEWHIQSQQGIINEKLAGILGFAVQDLQPMTLEQWRSRCHPEDYKIAQGLLARCLSGERKLFELEMRLRHKEGHWVWTLARGQVMTRDLQDNPLQMFGTLTSIQERKHREAQKEVLREHLMQSQKMESVGRLAGGIAHDFNNLLTVILGQAEACLSELGPDHPVNTCLKEIEEAAQRSSQLTRKLLAFARRQPAHPQLIDLHQTIKSSIDAFHEGLPKHVTLRWTPGNDEAFVNLDPIQLNQLMEQLLRNAVDAISGQGLIEVSTSVQTISEDGGPKSPSEKPGRFAVVSVADNGQGIEEASLARLFEPFFTTKEIAKGSGLGLATVDGIVNQNGGFIRVQSRVGEGSVFRLFLPLVDGERHSEDLATSTKTKLTRSQSTETILVVEDEPTVLMLTKRILERKGYKVLTAPLPDEAIEIFRANKSSIDLLLTDVMMPGMNGPEMVQVILKESPDLKCLYMSGYSADVIAEKGLLDRSVHIVEKPFSTRDLAGKVRAMLDGES